MARGLGMAMAIAMATKMSPGFSHTLATNLRVPPVIIPSPLMGEGRGGGGAFAITRHDTPKAVLIAYHKFEALVRDRASSLHDLHAEYDVLLARMQTPAAKPIVAAAIKLALG